MAGHQRDKLNVRLLTQNGAERNYFTTEGTEDTEVIIISELKV